MGISSLPAFRRTNHKRRLVAALGLCVLFMALNANANRGAVGSPVNPEHEAVENPAQEIRIKRLKLADPESTETMLVGVSKSLAWDSA